MHPLFIPITESVGPLKFETDPLTARFKRRELKRDERWLRVGETCRNLAFIETGCLRHYRLHEDQQLTRWAAFAGQFSTSISSFTQQRPSEESIEATEPTVLWELDHLAWKEMRLAHPQLQAFWVQTLEYLLGCYDDRVWSLIAGGAEERYRYMIARYPDFLLHLPQHFVADMLGIAPRHLSRIRNKMAKEGSKVF